MNVYKLIYILLGGLDSSISQLRKLVKEGNEQENEKTDPYVKKLLSEVFTGMQGRYSRLKIVLSLAEDPLNTFKLSKKLGYDYKTIQHNLKILEKNHLIERVGEDYGSVLFISELMSDNFPTLLKIIENVDKKLNKKKTYIP